MTHNHRGNKAISMLSGNIYWFLKHCYPFRTREYTKSAGIAYFYALSLEYLYPVFLPPHPLIFATKHTMFMKYWIIVLLPINKS